jgi:CheY-like chemotaxis protein
MMPRMDGIAFYRVIRADPAMHHIPVVLVSAALLPQSDLASLGAPFVVKPIDIEPFLRLVRDLLP